MGTHKLKQLRFRSYNSSVPMSSPSFPILPHDNVGLKQATPHQILMLITRNEQNRQRIFKQLQQLQIDTTALENLPLHEVYKLVEHRLKSSYSIKYMGLNQNEIGILSRRIDHNDPNAHPLTEFVQASYMINRYFYPKPLKVGRKKRPEETGINLDNLESEIKRSFDQNGGQKPDSRDLKKTESQKRLNKTSVLGSWISISQLKKLKDVDGRKSSLSKPHDTLMQEAQCILPGANKVNGKVNSYSRYLSKGTLLLRV